MTIVKPPSREAASASNRPRRLSLRSAHSQRGELGSYEVIPTSYFRFVHRPLFGMLSAVLIMMCAIYNGIQVEMAIKDEGSYGFNMWLIGDIMFTVAFTVELVLRFLAGRRLFLIGNDRWWNLFDAAVVASSILDVTLTLAGTPVATGFSILKVVRLVRILRIFRAGGAIPVVRSLRTMLHSLANSITAFVPALFLLFIVIYMFSLMFMEGFNIYMIHNSPPGNEGAVPVAKTIEQLHNRFGSVQMTFWTLVAMISGGVDWLDVLMLVRELGPFHVCLLMGYIFTVSFGLMNVLTGICVNAATQACNLNHELAVDSALSEKYTLSRELTMLFMECDVDQTNSLSWEEFQAKLTDERIKAYFSSLDLDMSSVLKVYEILDGDGDGELELSEFIEGCLAYRGNAKAVDICILQRENKLMLDKLGALEAALRLSAAPGPVEC